MTRGAVSQQVSDINKLYQMLQEDATQGRARGAAQSTGIFDDFKAPLDVRSPKTGADLRSEFRGVSGFEYVFDDDEDEFGDNFGDNFADNFGSNFGQGGHDSGHASGRAVRGGKESLEEIVRGVDWTCADILDAVTELRRDQGELRRELARVRGDFAAVKDALAALVVRLDAPSLATGAPQ